MSRTTGAPGEMGKLGDAKTLGGIGSILQIIPFLSIVGYILTLIAVKYVSDEVQDSSIFSNMLYAVITGIIGVAVGASVFFFGALASVTTGGIGAIGGFIGFLVIAWIALIISALFVRRAFEGMANKLGVGTFRTAGLLYFIGALLTIVLVGFILLFVAYILQVVAFFSINDSRQMAPAQPQAMAQAGVKYCVTCGAQMASAATFCPKCGAKQP
jgi:uncharacterized membrane protein/ribosomal protein L40E